ncbi:MAG: hypothetical protein ACI9JR_000637 [Gammaproteobacteria bacterium]|jgi:hypothetical protein
MTSPLDKDTFTPPAPLQTAVLFLVFNRPEPTAKVFQEIRKAKPPRLYIAADGPRAARDGEAEKVDMVRRIVEKVDWPCDVKTLFREHNAGCKYAVSSAIDWFFEQEAEGIILEDDCLPSQSFFWFCEAMLDRYRNDNRVWQISGTTFFADKITITDADYFFSRYGPIWGWASWRRAWQHYDVELQNWSNMKQPEVMASVYPSAYERVAKRNIGDALVTNQIDTWDYQWAFIKAYSSALTILAVQNQIVNIGFGSDATHTIAKPSSVPAHSFTVSAPIKHPKFVIADRFYEQNYAKKMFKKTGILFRIFGRIKALLQGVICR